MAPFDAHILFNDSNLIPLTLLSKLTLLLFLIHSFLPPRLCQFK